MGELDGEILVQGHVVRLPPFLLLQYLAVV